jgi:LAO/AO transport system kinase
MADAIDVAALVDAARSGQARAVARLLSVVEDGADQLPEAMAALAGAGADVPIIGITGSPGVGKSTTTNALIRVIREGGERVGVLAVDPSSPFTGGALLGDRVRMSEHAGDEDVFIRSMASRGHLGGLAAATPQAARVLAGVGYDVVILETVGVGQSEVEVAASADTTVVLLAPGMGDGIQAAKAGILEVGDVFAVNKADRDGADATVRELRAMLTLGGSEAGQWRPPVVRTVASTGDGIDELVAEIDRHQEHLRESGEGRRRRVQRAVAEVEGLVLGALRRRIDPERLQSLAARVASGDLDAFAAVDQLLD